ncbi:hypothetical protein F7R01_16875 [Pseudomonas argentinensis]|uniref:Cyclic GMP-AMP synthase n=1 Tax=Phytopseudomonas argentinensis TaxID=289370 RepID=A0A1I3GJJ4_9GAMM|nr:hypothetical protein [Pseudomonas argentinensis]KAB0549090.1 hypothetical protein F7R01_16875 [Pseudomonas argentinensis]SFI23658.1 hypothetical protein SAMN05216602_0145 [Pseudomonas argentinensis]
MLKFSKLFHKGGGDSDVYEDRIIPATEQRKFLISCKNKVREHLRARIRRATKEELGMERVVEPRFRTQGSWAYNTCVIPERTPPQEMDWDFGVYLPVTVWEENGPPHAMAKAYFDLVEYALEDLCAQENWQLLSGKDTCIRIQVAKWAHLDIPLYAAPEDEFEKVRERIDLAEARAVLMRKSEGLMDAVAFDFAMNQIQEQQWEDLDHVVMATRSGEWKASDPEVVANWFRDRVEEHGEQLRRVCRYLKAWRDFHWESGGPTSVSIMIAAAQKFERRPGRDDIAVEEAARYLSQAFLGNIHEEGIDNGQEDFNRLNEEGRRMASARFRTLATTMQDSRLLHEYQKSDVIRRLRGQFGKRIPDDINLVELDANADTIRNTAPLRVAPPVVPSTKAG